MQQNNYYLPQIHFLNHRKNHQRAMESLGASLEAEQRAKAEALRIKKKLESDINELEIALDHANKANAEGQKAIKRYQGQLRDTIQVSLLVKIIFQICLKSRKRKSSFPF